ncbi:MCE family protein [Sciscionella sediminilitoris]|uniref:MCE family protein n=1 Tax=Sciscionella sediminilitoris TaxID=1445613 RepID=UPI00056C018A|nr:MCE family protein [Sciscionella sp. SE31]
MQSWRKLLVLGVVLVLVALAGWFAFLRPSAHLTVRAEFTATASLFAGNKVTQLGLPIGKVESVVPHGKTATVTFTVPSSTKIPANAQAYVMNPDVISDQYLELTPTYHGGPLLRDGAHIPVERTHAPVPWDKLVDTLDTLAKAFGPSKDNPQGLLGGGLKDTAKAFDGNGKKVNEAIKSIGSASSLVVSGTPDAKRMLSSLQQLVSVVDENQSSIDSLSGTVNAITGEYQSHQQIITDTIGKLTGLMRQASDLLNKYGNRIDGTVKSFADTTQTLSDLRYQIVDGIKYLPLAMQNLSRTIKDKRARLRIDVSTNLRQFASTQELCKTLPNPLCSGAGIVNPIPGPPPPQWDPLAFLDPARGAK